MKRVLGVLLTFALFLFSGTVFGNNVPPSPTNSFYGDATGDMIIDAADIAQAKAWTLGLPYTYDTIQPAFPTQDWNTSDVTSDILIDAADLSALKSWTLGFTVVIPDKPWVLSNENLPLVANPIATPIAFQVNLASTVGTAFGRSGIPVVVQINAAASTTTGSLVGRTCAPLAGSRDQSSGAGDQCALSVSITDWYGAPGATKGLTETGTYGLKVIGNATGNLRLVFSIDSYPPGLDIPAITLGVVVGFIGGVNQPPSFTTTGGTTAGQGVLYSYTPALTDPDTGENLSCSLGTLNTCGGTLPADTPGVKPHTCTSYTFTPGAGLQSCQFRIVATDNGVPVATAGQTTTVTINRKPTWSTAPSNIVGVALGSTRAPAVDGIATDADVPAQVLTCSSGGTSCTFVPTVTGSSVAPTSCLVGFTANLTAQTCNLRIVVTDAGSPAATLGSTITITTVNNAPTFTTTGGTTGAQGVPYSYTAGTTDADTGENLTCTLGTLNTCAGTLPADTPGVKPHNCTAYTFTPGAALQSCQYRIVVTDNGVPAATAGQTTTVTINRAPTWSTAPGNIGSAIGRTYSATDGIANDADVPAQTLTCSSNGTSCTFAVNVTGAAKSPSSCWVGFTANLTAQICNLRIVVTDTGVPAATLGTTITITTVNDLPTFTTTGGTTARQGVAYNYAAATTDTDTGETLICTLGTLNTCAGTLPADTAGAKPHTCTTYNFTPGAGLQSCQFRIVVTDNGVPTATAGQTTTVTINRNPTWGTVPSNINVNAGEAYNSTNGVAVDVDSPAQTLTCSNNYSSCGFTVTVNGAAKSPASCNVSFAGQFADQGCLVRIMVADNGTPAATIGSTISIAVTDHPPTFTTTAPTTARQGITYSYTAIATDVDTGQDISCSIGPDDTCGGAMGSDTPGPKPHTCPAYTFTPGAGLQSCVVDIRAVDGGLQADQDTTVTINRKPTWSTAPVNINGIAIGATYSAVDGIATDADVPTQTLTCSSGGTSCTFTPTVTGAAKTPSNCTVGFTANLTVQTCNLRIVVTDTGSPAATLGSTITINTANFAPNFTSSGPMTGQQGVLYTYSAITTDPDTGETLTCTVGAVNTCGGTMSADGGGLKPHTCPAYTFTPGAGLQSCQFRLVVTDNGVPSNTNAQTTTVTINRAPTWSAAPTNITGIALGATYSAPDGVATDVDVPAQTLTCSSGGTSCTFTPTVTGAAKAPSSCTVGFTANLTVQTCNLRIVVTDNGSPAATLGSTITITTVNNPPSFTSTGGTTGSQGSLYSYAAVTTDADTGENLTCTLGTVNTCAGALPADTPGVKPHTCSAYTFTPGAGLQTCQFRIVVTDNGVPVATAGQTTSVTINRRPTWSTAPTNISQNIGMLQNGTDGIATDADVPAQTLTCSSNGTSCGFAVTVTGLSNAPTSCNVAFAAQTTATVCNLRMMVTDTGTPAATLGTTVQISIVQNPPTFTTTGPTTGRQGLIYTYTASANDADTGENLTCTLGTVNTCGGTLPADTPGVKPHTCTTYTFTPGAGLQSCQYRIVVTDTGTPAATAGQTTTVTINRAPTWSTAPTNIVGVALGSTRAPAVDGIATDVDVPAQILTCSSGGTSCPFTPTVTGSSTSPTNCLVGFTANMTAQTCNLRIVVTDAGTPAATLGSTISITTVNNPPTFTTSGGTTGRQGVLYSYSAITTDADTGENLSCELGTVNTCGASMAADTPGVKPHTCPTYAFTPGTGLQSCQFRIVVTDTGTPAATAGQTTTVTINRNPTWSTAPTNIVGVALGSTQAPTVDGIATDVDVPAQVLTCSSGGTSCPFTPTVTGSSVAPTSCLVGFTATLTVQTCNLRIVVTDAGVPAATLGSTITITTVNNPPTFSTTGGTTARQGALYSYTAGTTDADTGENLTCTLGTVNTCAGTLPADTPGVKPHNCTAYTFTPGAGLQTCQFRIVVTDNGVPAATAGQTTTVTINRLPTWSTAPGNITGIALGSTYSAVDGIATDVDAPAQTLTCSSGGTSCTFTPAVTGAAKAPSSCTVGFTANLTVQTCNLRIVVTDNGSPAATLGSTISITTVNNPPTFTTTGGTTARQGDLYSYSAIATDADTGENLNCTLGTLNTCAGTLPADTPGVKPHTCTAYTFTPGAGQQTCQFRIVVTDNGVPAATVGQTTTVTINRNPTWSTAPTNITAVPLGSTRAPAVDGIATDADVPAQVLTCSSGGTSCPFTPTVTGSSVAPTSCLVGFTATLTVQTCNLRIVVTDTGVPAATLGSTITITTVNNPPTFTTTGGTTARQGLLYSYTAGTTDVDTGENLTCTLGTVNTCTGSLPADTPGAKPHTCPAYSFTPGVGLQTCQFRIVITDNGTPVATAGQTTTVTINRDPTWSTAPTNIAGIALGSTRAPTVDGIATDVDVPAQILTCSSGGTSCTFTPTVTGSSVAPTSCLVGFTANLTAQTCNLRIVVTDAGTPAATFGSTITITTVNNPPSFTSTGSTVGKEGSLYTYSAITTDPDTNETLTCTVGAVNTCGGAMGADGGGLKPHTCPAYTFTPGASLQTCQFRIVVTDNGTPAATAGQTTTVTINRLPTWSATPANITGVALGSTYSAADGIATDVDAPAQTLTCSSGGTTCTFTPTVTGAAKAPSSCTVGFTANLTVQTCNLRIVVTDTGVPAATLGTTITITTVNNPPTFTTTGGTTARQGVLYSYTAAATDADTGENLTCTLGTLNTCSGVLPADTAGAKPHTCTTYTFTPGSGQQTCRFRIVVTDNGVPAATAGQTTTVTINRLPTWSTAPTNLTAVPLGSTYSAVDGIATDADVPAQILTCSSGGTSCPFTPTVTGSSVAPTSCLVGFTANLTVQTCNLRIVVTDTGVTAATLGTTITITTVNNGPTWSTAPGPITANINQVYSTVDGIASDDDTGETLTCSANGTSCVGFPVGPTVTGSSVKPVNCTVGFTAPAATQTCNLRIMVTDNGVPAVTLGSTITIDITGLNYPPSFTSTGPTTAVQSVLYSYAAATTDPDTGQNLTCTLGTVNTCAGTLPADTPGVKPHTCTAYTFTPGAGLQTCQFRLVVADNGSGALTAGQTTTVAINRLPTWSTTPTDLNVYIGNPYNSTDGTATDVDTPAQTLTCSSNGTSCGFTPVVSGSTVAPTECNVSFPAQSTLQTCYLRILVTDTGVPSATLGTTITINIVDTSNTPPTFITTAPTSAQEGIQYSYTASISDADAGNYLSCTKSPGDTCGGSMITDTPSVSPHSCPTYTFTPGSGVQNCVVGIRAFDGTFNTDQNTTVTINRMPVWSTAPSAISSNIGDSYNATNGVVTDPDTPAQTLTCSSNGTSCAGFTPDVSGSNKSPVNCNVSFPIQITPETCDLRIVVTDTGIPSATLGATVTISVINSPPTFTTTAPTNAQEGIVYNYTASISDADTGETLSCVKSPGDTCGGTMASDTPGLKPHTCPLYTFTPDNSIRTCVVGIRASDGSLTTDQDTTVTIDRLPTWSTEPLDISRHINSTFNRVNGQATDPDTGQTLTCAITATTCSFISTGTIGTGPNTGVDCTLNFTAGSSSEECTATIRVSDGEGLNITTVIDVDTFNMSVSAGGSHTCALTSSGGVKCWGYNNDGELGNGTSGNNSLSPVDVTGLTSGVKDISSGSGHTCALTTSGGAKCWGYNYDGELGDGTSGNISTTPVNVSGLTSGVAAISAGGSHTCALTTSGGVKCWGFNYYGQLGDGTNADSNIPVDVSGLSSGVVAISAGGNHTCALTSSGGIKCWGYNGSGQLGDASYSDSNTPVNVSGLTTGAAGVTASSAYSCGITIYGAAKCWGDNTYGQLGDGTNGGSNTPVSVSGLSSEADMITTRWVHTCVQTTDGGAKCWGSNSSGQLGNNTITDSNVPVDVSGLSSGVYVLSAGNSHTCALTSLGDVKCWGDNTYGQIGNGVPLQHNTPVDVSGLTSGVDTISTGVVHTCAVTTLGAAKCWGNNLNGQLGDGTVTQSATPIIVSGFTSGAAMISVGQSHTCAVTTSGGAKCWGANGNGQIGDGSNDEAHTPVDVSGLTNGVAMISVGAYHTCVVTTSQGAKCWGYNYYGQLGNSSNTDTNTPVDVTGLTNGVAAIYAGMNQTCALTISGRLKCWGYNGNGELGDGSNTDSNEPVDVSGLHSHVATATAGGGFSCAVTDSGGAQCWGYNGSGELGDGTNDNSNVPVDVSGLSTTAATISAGGNPTCAVTTTGGAKCWGYNYYGELGDGTIIDSNTPVDVTGLTSGVDMISAGGDTVCAVTSSGGAKCWGYNFNGQLGNGEQGIFLTPVNVVW